MIDLIGHLGYIMLIVGSMLVGRNRASGWALRLGGSIVWAVLGVLMGMSSIWIWSAAFAAVDYYNWRKWKCDSSRDERSTR